MSLCVCVFTPEAINYIHVILNLYNQLNKFVAFRNIIAKFSMHGRGLYDKNQPNKAVSAVKVVSFTERVVLTDVHE